MARRLAVALRCHCRRLGCYIACWIFIFSYHFPGRSFLPGPPAGDTATTSPPLEFNLLNAIDGKLCTALCTVNLFILFEAEQMLVVVSLRAGVKKVFRTVFVLSCPMSVSLPSLYL
jgi:hypothetical protein